MGYAIGVDVNGTAWHIERYTNNLSFNVDERISGSGNFSRYNYLKPHSDMGFSEKSSAVRGGNISLNDTLRFRGIEGPIQAVYTAQSSARRVLDADGEGSDLRLSESFSLTLDESWPYIFTNRKDLSYSGKGIKTAERYDNNGEIISLYSDSWRLSKESQYVSVNNKTTISLQVLPNRVNEQRFSRKSSSYQLDLKSLGPLSSLDVIRTRPLDEDTYRVSTETVSRIAQDYKGYVSMNLAMATRNSIKSQPFILSSNNDTYSASDYLPCCDGGYYDMEPSDRRYINADSIFNCDSGHCPVQFP